MTIFKRPLKEIILFILVSVLCWFSVVKSMQLIALACLVVCVCIVYKNLFVQFWSDATQLIFSARQAKIGGFELQIDQKVVNLSVEVAKKCPWAGMLLYGLSSEHIALLLTVKRAVNYKPYRTQLQRFRELRNRTLISHDATSLPEANIVFLTDLGIEVCEMIENTSSDFTNDD